MTTEVATTTDLHPAIVEFGSQDVTELRELIAEEYDGDIGGMQFEYMKVGKGFIEVPSEDGSGGFEIEKTVTGVIVHSHEASALWLDEDDGSGENRSPDARSFDGVNQIINPEAFDKCRTQGLPFPSPVLAECPYNQFESAGLIGKDGAGKATKNTIELYVMLPGAIEPMILSLPPTSMKGYKAFKRFVVTKRKQSMAGVLVEISARKEQAGSNEWGVAEFKLVDNLPAELTDGMKVMRDQVKQYVASRATTFTEAPVAEATVADPVAHAEAAADESEYVV